MSDSAREDTSHTLRILVATDCHLGYLEKDEIRRHDSFLAFEEICSIAEEKKVDFMLLGGDLFHENKPSRSTLVKAIEILRRHCLNDQPIQFQVVSDQTVNFPNSFGHVNYEDPHFNVGLPVFSIHGNHDDPAGVDNLSAVDILSACNLVNYFGKMVLGGSGVGQITLYPILIRKGSTAVALYGLGNIRDERLNRIFQTPHAVQWMRPEAQEGFQVSDWFNILVLHQNRVKTNPKNAINEHFLPRFLDFIVWGHEHECLIDPQEVSGMGFHITQPGSSVATSLIEGESKQKHVLLLEVKGNQYRPTKIPLTSVRPFEYKEVVLKDEPEIDANDQNSILEHLDTVVGDLIEKSNKKTVNRSELMLPLVRVKVDYSGFMTINPQRFGQKYVGKVANPQDILIFSKASKRTRNEAKIDDSERLRPEELNQQNIEALVAENNLKMEILPVNDLDVALQNFVNKDDKYAFHNCVQYNLEETRNKIAKESDALNFQEGDLILKVGECFEESLGAMQTFSMQFIYCYHLYSPKASPYGLCCIFLSCPPKGMCKHKSFQNTCSCFSSGWALKENILLNSLTIDARFYVLDTFIYLVVLICRNVSRKGLCTLRIRYSLHLVDSSLRKAGVKVLQELEVQLPLVMMKTQHRQLALPLEAGKDHQEFPGHLVVLQNELKVKLLQEEGVLAEVRVT
ncbi:hypothetical protein SLEP1_g49922 [Rubroshorea leprosula]|uniref:Double-strand break repair protein MRE11 n=1 Tax=Rubroshorea leprosula TaxID=152421 RepID=A0AAV5LYC1_9ROSI|nr:hypothetical protein SLEP1_g49922 [Rubroshorea leprosula]